MLKVVESISFEEKGDKSAFKISFGVISEGPVAMSKIKETKAIIKKLIDDIKSF
ncbi:hypothetical protein oki169_07480 [Helicobacter pylori]